MRIEIIYPEIANLLGEHGTQQLLQQTFAAEEIICTNFPDLPVFFREDVDFIYMGAMTENTQALVLDQWRPYAKDFRQKIDNGLTGFFAGNALDLLGRHIIYEEAETIQALGLYPFDTLCKRFDRKNEIVRGRFRDFELMGYRSQFTTHTGDSSVYPFIEVINGSGMNPESKTEGIADRNFFASSLTGPFLILNPEFTKWLFSLFGFRGELPFQSDLLAAAELRREDLRHHFDVKKSRKKTR
ncbi:MAG: hypothetical protein PHR37_02990 [Eubacteriales bacterium]|nr:hypothetical protein [Eubacteriales bacterium]MDD4323788.1 hypothetical protein [Eubacteriales bacterium]